MNKNTSLENKELSSVAGGYTSDGQIYTFIKGDCFKDNSWTYKVKQDHSNANKDTKIDVDVFLYYKLYGSTKIEASELDGYQYLGTNAI